MTRNGGGGGGVCNFALERTTFARTPPLEARVQPLTQGSLVDHFLSWGIPRLSAPCGGSPWAEPTRMVILSSGISQFGPFSAQELIDWAIPQVRCFPSSQGWWAFKGGSWPAGKKASHEGRQFEKLFPFQPRECTKIAHRHSLANFDHGWGRYRNIVGCGATKQVNRSQS